MKSLIFLGLVLIWCSPALVAQDRSRPSVHQTESEFYAQHPELVGKEIPPPLHLRKGALLEPATLSKVIYGFHPYWISDATAQAYYYSLLTHVAYFSAEVDTATGGFVTTRSWTSTQLVNYAKSYGVKVHLCITLFYGHAKVLGDSTKRANLINSILTQVNARSADGVNIDFESMASSVASDWKQFIFDLGTTLKAQGKELVVELPAVDWSGLFPASFFTMNNSVVDYYFLMAYDYYWSGSSTAGPVSPLTTGTTIRHVMRSIDAYLAAGATTAKLLCGLPYYGLDWPVTSDVRMASTTGTSTSRTYSVARSYVDTLSQANKFFDSQYNVPWYRYQSGGNWRQTWYDNEQSLAQKYDSIKARSIAGTGMWALGYDGAYTELWLALKTAFSSSPDPAHTVLADFETSVGVFDKSPTFSGSTTGIATSSSSARTVGAANNGLGSLEVTLTDNASSTNNWTVRLLSGTGNRANNQQLSRSGYIGLWLKTSTAPTGAQVAVTIDDKRFGSTDETELSSKQTIINDGAWHLYEWNLTGGGWTSFSGGNGVLDSSVVSLDAVMLYAPNGSPDWTLHIDDVSHNNAGALPVQLAWFSVEGEQSSALVLWTTAAESENFGFEVERRSVGGSLWTTRGFMPGNGTTSWSTEYRFRDESVPPGRYAYRLRQINRDGSYSYTGSAEVDVGIRPTVLSLEQNYPNPFNPTTTIEFMLSEDGLVTLSVFNALGEEVALLLDGALRPGRHAVSFHAGDLPTGVYFAQLRVGESTLTRKMMILR